MAGTLAVHAFGRAMPPTVAGGSRPPNLERTTADRALSGTLLGLAGRCSASPAAFHSRTSSRWGCSSLWRLVVAAGPPSSSPSHPASTWPCDRRVPLAARPCANDTREVPPDARGRPERAQRRSGPRGASRSTTAPATTHLRWIMAAPASMRDGEFARCRVAVASCDGSGAGCGGSWASCGGSSL
jgi:hypothetical protein